MKNQFIKMIKVIIIILIILIIIQIFIEEYRYKNQITEPPTTNSILVSSYVYIRNDFIYYFKKIIYLYFNI